MPKTVLITGAGGNIGRKLTAHFTALGWRLRLLDAVGGGDIVAADLSVWEERWAAMFRGVDAVVHLAGRPSPDTSWDDAVRYNIDLTQNVFEAAARFGAGRVIFASSNWTMAGHRFGDGALTTDRAPYPVNAYGVSKLMGERLARSYHERWGLSAICFRIGWCQPAGNQPGSHMDWGSWGQLMWVSDRDICQAHDRAVLAEGVGFAVLNLMSDNPGMRWDIETTKRVIGYAPQDGAVPVLTDDQRRDEAEAERLVAASRDVEAVMRARRW